MAFCAGMDVCIALRHTKSNKMREMHARGSDSSIYMLHDMGVRIEHCSFACDMTHSGALEAIEREIYSCVT